MLYCECELNSLTQKRKEVNKLINLDMLNDRIKDSGMTVVAIAEKSGILRETLYNKLRGHVDFKASEIYDLSKVLNLTGEEIHQIFFAD